MIRRALLAVVLLATSIASAQEFGVRYRSQNNVYLDAGTASGINVGDRFEITRGGKVIATVEVIYAAERSASARIVSETTAVREGDRARRIGGSKVEGQASRAPAPPANETTPRPSALDPRPSDLPRPSALSPWPSFSGSASLDFENATDASRTLARINLRARNLGALPLQLRVRLRAANEADESRNRLYEASLMYEPRDFRIGVRAGRIGNSPFIGLGYLDGALVRVRIIDGFEAGAFYGFRPDPRDLTFDTSTTKLGGYLRAGGDAQTRRPWDLVVAAVQQQGENDESNNYISIDGRLAPNDRVSFFGHGRIGSADEEDGSLNTMLAMVYRASSSQSLTLSYERIEPGADDDLRTPGQVVDDFLRQGAHLTYQNRWITLGGGIRTGESEAGDDNTYSATAGVSHPNIANRQWFAGVNATGFSSPLTDGLFVHARFGKRLARGHTIELSAGSLITDETAIEELQQTAWIRGALWLELPADLFARAEYEAALGDNHTGNRVTIGAGYRF
jgi:hypothetical protein